MLSAEEGVGEQFDVFFKAGEMGTISPSSQSSSPSGALVTWNVVVDPEVVDTKTSIKFSFISIDIPSTKKVGMNRGRNRKKKKKRNRRKHRGKHGSKQNSDEECPDGWVMIVEGEPKRSNPRVILKKTCNTNKMEALERTIKVVSNRAQVYFKKGKLQGDFQLTVEPFAPSDPSKCLWDCDFKVNPVFQETVFWRIGGWNVNDPCGEKDEDRCVRIQLTTPTIPRNLSCLDDCFFDMKRNDYKYKCRTAKYAETYSEPQSEDKDIDCILLNRKSQDRQDITDDFPPSLFNEWADGQDIVTENADQTSNTAKILMNNFLPSRPSDIALMFCIMANLDARHPRRLSTNTIGQFYLDPDPIWNNENCSAFLPILDWGVVIYTEKRVRPQPTGTLSESSSGSQKRRPKTRIGGSASEIIER